MTLRLLLEILFFDNFNCIFLVTVIFNHLLTITFSCLLLTIEKRSFFYRKMVIWRSYDNKSKGQGDQLRLDFFLTIFKKKLKKYLNSGKKIIDLNTVFANDCSFSDHHEHFPWICANELCWKWPYRDYPTPFESDSIISSE